MRSRSHFAARLAARRRGQAAQRRVRSSLIVVVHRIGGVPPGAGETKEQALVEKFVRQPPIAALRCATASRLAADPATYLTEARSVPTHPASIPPDCSGIRAHPRNPIAPVVFPFACLPSLSRSRQKSAIRTFDHEYSALPFEPIRTIQPLRRMARPNSVDTRRKPIGRGRRSVRHVTKK